MSDELKISPITLGLLYEQITASSLEKDPTRFWRHAFSNLRWILPYVRLAFLKKADAFHVITHLYQHGQIYQDEDLSGKKISGDLEVLFGIKTIKWIADPKKKYQEQLDKKNELISWLVSDDISDLLLVPIGKGNDEFGVIVFALKNISDADKILISTLLSIYMSYLLMNFHLISELVVKKKREEKLLHSESVRVKLANLNEELNRKIEIFNKFVPSEFLCVLGVDKEIDYIELGYNKSRNISVLFSDIRSFTSLSDKMTSDKVFEFINNYLSVIAPTIIANKGFVDKYIGDSIMAVFTTPEAAVTAGIEMLAQLEKYNQQRAKKNEPEIKIGIGINTGVASMGTIGFSDHMETTVIGSVVNVASRLEQLSKQYKTPLILSDATAKAIMDNEQYKLRYLDYVKVRGVENEVNIFELLNHFSIQTQEAKLKLSPIYKTAVGYYWNNNLDQAKQGFEECLAMVPDDVVTKKYLEMIKAKERKTEDE